MPYLWSLRRVKRRSGLPKIIFKPAKIRAELEKVTEKRFDEIKDAQIGSLAEAQKVVLD